MISWLLPTVRGAFEFSVTATTNRDLLNIAGDITQQTQGTSSRFTTENQTGSTTSSRQQYSTYGSTKVVTGTAPATAFVTNTASSAFDESDSSSTVSKLPAYTTTTTTDYPFADESYLQTTLTEGATTYWTTATAIDTNVEFSFVTSESAIEDSLSVILSPRLTSRTVVVPISESVNTNGETVYSSAIANTYDTIYEAQYESCPAFEQEGNSSGNEYLVAMNTFIEAKDWAWQPMAASGYTTGGTRLTMTAPVFTSSVLLAHSSASQTLAVSQITTQTPYHTSATESLTDARSSFKTTAFPPQTFEIVGPNIATTLIETQTAQTIRRAATFTHYGNTKTDASAAILRTTCTDVLQDGRTFSQSRNPFGILFETQTTANFSTTLTTPVYLTESNVSASGNTSFVKDRNNAIGIVGSRLLEILDFNRKLEIEGIGTCKIVKPHGVVLGSQTGQSFTADAPSFSASVYGQASRQVTGDELDGVSALWTFATTSNNSFTLSSDGLTFTTLNGTSRTTSSASVSVTGTAKTAVVASKSVLGGSPEEAATFYQFAYPGVYSFGDGQFTTITGYATKIEHGETTATFVPRWINHLNYGAKQIVVVDRNPIAAGVLS
jgi:hypothetical protein